MEKARSQSDVHGYIYTFEIRGALFTFHLHQQLWTSVQQIQMQWKPFNLKSEEQSTLSSELINGASSVHQKNKSSEAGTPELLKQMKTSRAS
jgi:hypothetical protein